MNTLNNNAFKILTVVGNKKDNIGLCEARGITKDLIVQKSGFSSSTVNRAIKVLLEHEFIAEAIMQVNKKAYYVTQKGINRIKEINKI
ncbi:hypothetical protein [Clostridium sp. 1001283B150210_160208_E6]|uniref:hypothetical protein n=1 Tax=Clostridium sp. 1001283B150210_160208_E6 TaxID=2787129 RepID=UPI0018AB454A|nr:hypothetical protein [Clostridium sp. 1001283B150210_160208_E6]